MATQYSSGLIQLTYDCPKGYRVEPETFSSVAEARRRVYFHNRKYISETLRHWLNQRIWAFRSVDSASQLQIATELLNRLTDFKDSSLWKLCDWVERNQRNIRLIAPGTSSQYYKFYHDIILPIIIYCLEKEEAIV